MKILIHGATNGSNYGDVLFADLFYKAACESVPSKDVFFMEMPIYGISEFYRNELEYTQKMSLKDLHEAELLVYISGGYFGETNSNIKDNIKRFFRYFWLGLYFLVRKKKIVICGVGGAPISNRILLKTITFIMNKAQFVTVRDNETKDYFISKGVRNDIQVTTDTAQVIDKNYVEKIKFKEEKIIDEIFNNKKIIFLHVGITPKDDAEFKNKIIDGLNKFLAQHPDYGVVYGNDGLSKFNIEEFESIKALNCETKYYYKYSSARQLSSLLNKVDFVVTPKLHVGIISSSLGKSVVSFPVHKQKTLRYYRQIGEAGRCMLFSDINAEIVKEMMEQYYDKPIKVDDSIRQIANINIEVMKKAIEDTKKNNL